MFIPFIYPILYNYENAEKKEIIYSDVVLNINDLGSNIKVNSIYNVDKDEFDKCLKIILNTNKDVIFKTIQYSEKNKKIYFYTDKYINTDAWYESKYFHYKPVKNRDLIINEIDSILEYNPTKNENYISLYSYYKFIYAFKKFYNEIAQKHLNILTKKMKKINSYSDHIFRLGYYVDNELKLEYERYKGFTAHEIIFSKKNNDLYIKKSDTYDDKEILYHLGNEISEFFDEIKKYERFTHIVHTPRLLNSYFKVILTDWHVRLYLNDDVTIEINNIYNKFEISCNSNEINNIIKDNCSKLFENIFIKIEDVEEFKELLSMYRKDEIKELLKKEEKAERILTLKKKYLPWFYK